LTAKKPISAVDITAERTIRPKRIRISMDCTVLEATDYAGWPEIPESPVAIPYCLEMAMYDLVERNTVIGTYRTSIHGAVDVPYGRSGRQAYAENMSRYQIVALHVRRKIEVLERIA
jgi:hypothetical protein